MFKVAHTTLAQYPNIKKVTIMEHAPRFDTPEVDPLGLKHKLANFSNNYFLQLWLDSPYKDKIVIGKHTLDCTNNQRQIRYTDGRTGKYDGVHLYSRDGQIAYTQSVLNILLSSFHTQPQSQSNKESYDHSKCPQAIYMKNKNTNKGQTRNYNVKVSNRFGPLSCKQGNF